MLIPRTVYNIGLARSFDQTRFQLLGVFLERFPDGRCSAVTTNGKILARATWTEPDWKEYPTPDEFNIASPVEGFKFNAAYAPLEAASKSLPRKPLRPILDFICLDEQKSEYHATGDLESWGRWSAPRLEGEFPNYLNAFGEPKATTNILLRPEYLKMATDIVSRVCGDKDLVIDLQLCGSDLPCVLRGKGTDNDLRCEVLVMPKVVAK